MKMRRLIKIPKNPYINKKQPLFYKPFYKYIMGGQRAYLLHDCQLIISHGMCVVYIACQLLLYKTETTKNFSDQSVRLH